MQKLLDQVNQLRMHVPDYEKLQPAVSSANIGWHIQHMLLVFNRIITAVENSDPTLYKSSFNIKKSLVYTFNKMPRGKAVAPKTVKPIGQNIPETLLPEIETVIEKINTLATLQKNHHFPHPFFGKLNLRETERFLYIHTNHHLKIINDILNVKNG